MNDKLKKDLLEFISSSKNKTEAIKEVKEFLFDNSPLNSQPIDYVRWVSVEDIEANDYNPNSVANKEMSLLYTSILHDGYTQPVVCVLDKSCDILLQCGHKAQINHQNSKLWDIIPPLNKKSHILLPLLMQTGQLPNSMENYIMKEKVDIEFKYPKKLQTMVRKYVSGFKKSGGLEKSTLKQDYAISTSGMLQELTTSGSYSHIVCPTCLSKKGEQENCWSTYLVKPPTEGEDGLLVSYKSSKVGKQPVALLKDYEEVSTESELKEKNLDYPDLSGTPENYLVIIDRSKAIIVDGFHRYFVCKSNKDIRDRNNGLLPIVVLKKDINDRMASTVRHNRARGKHSVEGMSSMVFKMLDNGWDDTSICNELGMEAEELLRLKHITGFSKLFENFEYSKAWKTKHQLRIEKEYKEREK